MEFSHNTAASAPADAAAARASSSAAAAATEVPAAAALSSPTAAAGAAGCMPAPAVGRPDPLADGSPGPDLLQRERQRWAAAAAQPLAAPDQFGDRVRALEVAALSAEAFAKAGRGAASKGRRRVASAAGPVDVKMPGGALEPQSLVHPESAYRRGPGEKLPGLEALEISDPDKVQGQTKKVYLGRSCCVLRPAYLPRRLCIYLVEWKLFEPIVLMATLVNCVAIALESPSEEKSKLKESFINVREHSGLTHARLSFASRCSCSIVVRLPVPFCIR